MKLYKNLLLILVIAFSLNGCGAGDSSSNFTNNVENKVSSTLAEPNYNNANRVKEAIFFGIGTSSMYRARVADNNDAFKPFIISFAQKFIILNSSLKKRAKIVSGVCKSGAIDVEVINQTSSRKTVIYKYNNCNNGTKIINGDVRLELSKKYNNIYYNQKIIFSNNYRVRYLNGNSLTIANGANISIAIENYNLASDYTFNLNTSMRITHNGYSYGYEGMNLHYIVDNYQIYWYQSSGKIFINNYKNYVLYDSSYNMFYTPFKTDSNNNPINGEIRYKMASNATLRLIAQGGNITLDIE